MMNEYYKAAYAGNGKCFNLVAVFQPDISEGSVNALLVQLHQASCAIIFLDSDTRTPPIKLDVSCKPN